MRTIRRTVFLSLNVSVDTDLPYLEFREKISDALRKKGIVVHLENEMKTQSHLKILNVQDTEVAWEAEEAEDLMIGFAQALGYPDGTEIEIDLSEDPDTCISIKRGTEDERRDAFEGDKTLLDAVGEEIYHRIFYLFNENDIDNLKINVPETTGSATARFARTKNPGTFMMSTLLETINKTCFRSLVSTSDKIIPALESSLKARNVSDTEITRFIEMMLETGTSTKQSSDDDEDGKED